MTWYAKPSWLSPVHCARYGWQNIDADLLQCVCCKALLNAKLPSPDQPKVCEFYSGVELLLSWCHFASLLNSFNYFYLFKFCSTFAVNIYNFKMAMNHEEGCGILAVLYGMNPMCWSVSLNGPELLLGSNGHKADDLSVSHNRCSVLRDWNMILNGWLCDSWRMLQKITGTYTEQPSLLLSVAEQSNTW